MKNFTKPTTRKAVVQAIAKQDKETKPQLAKENLDDAIRLKAYELYIQRGGQSGNDVEDWLTAERIVSSSQNA